MTSSIPGNTGMIAQYQHGKRTRRWYLGIQSKKNPAHVMAEVFKALLALGCEWLQLSSYRIKCKWRPNGMNPGASSRYTIPSAGGATPDAAWNRSGGQANNGGDMDMDVDKKGCGPDGFFMQVVAGGDGHEVAVPTLSTPAYSIKIGLTLYKVQQNIYLLDFQKKTGDAFSFMTLCANIITELKNLSAASRQKAAQDAQRQAAAQQQQQQQRQNAAAASATS
eukprot:CAMPEP_0198112206 /NCGR_PEP_ID=MMETSP1442-20131203/4091_1 /TAXON_ID= /ORGANISM="Craspedostauros australis, Strain CCMP3328" /LENGTH=221 /DNA_ID=CAMNT_0043768903 /DNA_START=3 /DNA_END=671 /DNA_ORIENTATION=-